MTVLELKGVSKVYPNRKGDVARVVLRDIDLSIEENEFVCIVGPSGGGKTTLLNLMAGFEKPDAGLPLPSADLVDRAVAYLPEIGIPECIVDHLQILGTLSLERFLEGHTSHRDDLLDGE